MSARLYAFYRHAVHGNIHIEFILDGSICYPCRITSAQEFEISRTPSGSLSVHAPDGRCGIPQWVYEFIKSDQIKSIMVSELGDVMRNAEYVRNELVKAGAS